MKPKIFVVPAEGLRVPTQALGGEIIPAEGMMVDQSFYIARRVMAGDLVVPKTKPRKSRAKKAPEPVETPSETEN